MTFLIVRPTYPMIDDSWCARTFSSLEATATQWQRPSVKLQQHVNQSRVIFCLEVRELHTLYVYIYIVYLFQKFFWTQLGYLFTPLQRCGWCILQPQPTGQNLVLVSLFNGISPYVGYLMPKPACRRTEVVLFNP